MLFTMSPHHGIPYRPQVYHPYLSILCVGNFGLGFDCDVKTHCQIKTYSRIVLTIADKNEFENNEYTQKAGDE